MKVRRSTFARLRVGIDTAVLLAAVVGFTALKDCYGQRH